MRYRYRICYNQALNKYRVEYRKTFKEYVISVFHSGNPFPILTIALYIISIILVIFGYFSSPEAKEIKFILAGFISCIASGFIVLGLIAYLVDDWEIAKVKDKFGLEKLDYVNCPLDCNKIISDLKEKLEKIDRWVPYLEKIK